MSSFILCLLIVTFQIVQSTNESDLKIIANSAIDSGASAIRLVTNMAKAATPLVQNVGKFTRDVAVPSAVNGAQKGCDAFCTSVLPAVKKAAQDYGAPAVNGATPYLKNVAINSGEVAKMAYNAVVRPSAAAVGYALQQMPELPEASSSNSGSNKRSKGKKLKRPRRSSFFGLFKKKN